MTDTNNATAGLVKEVVKPLQNEIPKNEESILEINLNEEYKIKIEDADKLSDSYFKDIYRKAGQVTADILAKSKKANTNKTDRNPFKRQDEEYNNIIAFCGERGTGKSSAMITYAQSLFEINNCNDFYKESPLLKEYKYFPIEVIDPSMFEEKENIFEVVLAQLFSSFEKELNDSKRKYDLEKKRQVLELFQKV